MAPTGEAMTPPENAAGQRWWQRCRWVVIGSTYEPPVESLDTGGFKARGDAARSLLATLDRLTQGFTTLTFRCVLCGDVRTRIVPGKATGHV